MLKFTYLKLVKFSASSEVSMLPSLERTTLKQHRGSWQRLVDLGNGTVDGFLGAMLDVCKVDSASGW